MSDETKASDWTPTVLTLTVSKPLTPEQIKAIEALNLQEVVQTFAPESRILVVPSSPTTAPIPQISPPAPKPFPPPDATIAEKTRAVLKKAIITGTFSDTRFSVRSRRSRSKVTDVPAHISANSVFLRGHSNAFDRLLSQAEETNQSNLSDYDADSDFDDDEAKDVSDNCNTKPSSQLDRRSRTSDTATRTSTRTASFDSEIDIQSISIDLDSMSEIEEKEVKREEPKFDDFAGHTIVVNDAPLNTWRALIYFLHTGEVEFAPLRSQSMKRVSESEDHSWPDACRPPACSPKSLYRLAHKYDLKELRDLAFKDLCAKLSVKNILEELFSEFTSRHPEVMKMEIEFVCDNCNDDKIVAMLPQWIGRVAKGELPHCSEVLSSVYVRLATMASQPRQPVAPPSFFLPAPASPQPATASLPRSAPAAAPHPTFPPPRPAHGAPCDAELAANLDEIPGPSSFADNLDAIQTSAYGEAAGGYDCGDDLARAQRKLRRSKPG